MGLDLTLLPAFTIQSDFSHDMLKLDRDYKLFDKIKSKAKTYGVQVKEGGISCYLSRDEIREKRQYGPVETDEYGKKLQYLTAKHLDKIFYDYKTDSWKNKAVFAFIHALPKETPVYLYWG